MIDLFKKSRRAARDQLDLVFLNVCGLVFIYVGVAWVGTIYVTLITTTRKIFTVLISIVVHDHDIDVFQKAGIVLVCLGIVLELQHGVRAKLSKVKEKSK